MAGEVWGVVGPNGSGKTTLLRALGGLMPCRRGRVLLEGYDVGRMSARKRARLLAWLPQTVELLVSVTVRELVSLGRLPYTSGWMPLSSADRLAVDEALKALDLLEAERPLHELSAGEQQRALVAMALAQQPRVLILDEPTAHLDIHHATRLMSTIVQQARARNMGVIVSLHDLNLAAVYCDRLILLSGGRVAAVGAWADVLRQDVLESVYHMPMEIIRRTDETIAILPHYGAGGGGCSG